MMSKGNRENIEKISLEELSVGTYNLYKDYDSCKRCKADVFQTDIKEYEEDEK